MRRKKIFYGIISLALLVIVLLLLLRPWNNLTINSKIVLSTDAQAAVVSHRLSAQYAKNSLLPPSLQAEFDLAEFAGQHVRLDLSSEILERWSGASYEGLVCYAAQLISSEGAQEIRFSGWHRDNSRNTHPAAVGSPAFQISLQGQEPAYYDLDNALWHVLKVPPKARLLLQVRPLLPAQLTAEPKYFVPDTPTYLPLPEPPAANPDSRPPDVFIYLIDALRADHLGCYGYERPTSANIDAFAETAILFESAHTTASWTRPAVTSLFTGLYPSAHGSIHRKTGKLRQEHTILSEMMRACGYQTYAVSTNANIVPSFGFDRGFDGFKFKSVAEPDWINQRAREFLRAADTNKPVFMYLHHMEPHMPYLPEPDSERLFDRGFKGRYQGRYTELGKVKRVHPNLTKDDIGRLIDRYDAEIYDNDRGFAEFLTLLKRYDRFENSIIILLADHGESFVEHGTFIHGWSLNSSEMHIPLIVRLPSGELSGRRVEKRASIIDIYPTLLARIPGAAPPDYPLPGASLVQIAQTSSQAASRVIFAELSMKSDCKHDLIAVIDSDGYKRIIDASIVPEAVAAKESLGLWHIEKDPAERTQLLGELPVRAAFAEQRIAHWLHSRESQHPHAYTRRDPVKIPEKRRRELEALGYLR